MVLTLQLLSKIAGDAVNSLADYSAAAVLQAACTADVRKGLLQTVRANLRRTRSAGGHADGRTLAQLPSRAIEVLHASIFCFDAEVGPMRGAHVLLPPMPSKPLMHSTL